MFSIYLQGNPINVCWNPQNRAHFSETINLRGHIPRFTQNECFAIYLQGNPINVLKPSKQGSFSETMDLRGHMPRFTWKMIVFPSISLEIP